jgi:hypothetical protein
MRDSRDIKSLRVETPGGRGQIVSFWLAEDKTVYAKIRNYKGQTINHRISTLSDDINIVEE